LGHVPALCSVVEMSRNLSLLVFHVSFMTRKWKLSGKFFIRGEEEGWWSRESVRAPA
jgi:hypothetical protein